MELEKVLCEKARGFPIIILYVPSTYMSALYNRYLKRIRVFVRGEKAKHHDKKNYKMSQ